MDKGKEKGKVGRKERRNERTEIYQPLCLKSKLRD